MTTAKKYIEREAALTEISKIISKSKYLKGA